MHILLKICIFRALLWILQTYKRRITYEKRSILLLTTAADFLTAQLVTISNTIHTYMWKFIIVPFRRNFFHAPTATAYLRRCFQVDMTWLPWKSTSMSTLKAGNAPSLMLHGVVCLIFSIKKIPCMANFSIMQYHIITKFKIVSVTVYIYFIYYINIYNMNLSYINCSKEK